MRTILHYIDDRGRHVAQPADPSWFPGDDEGQMAQSNVGDHVIIGDAELAELQKICNSALASRIHYVTVTREHLELLLREIRFWRERQKETA